MRLTFVEVVFLPAGGVAALLGLSCVHGCLLFIVGGLEMVGKVVGCVYVIGSCS